jgi:hypothetical protein
LSHAFGAAFDNRGLIVACVIGDGEAETGPLAKSWQSNQFLDAGTDGAVLPILHLNGFKISNPTVLARIEGEELEQFLPGCGWAPRFVEGDDPQTMQWQATGSILSDRDGRPSCCDPPKAGRDPRWSTGSRSRGLFAPIRRPCWSIRSIRSGGILLHDLEIPDYCTPQTVAARQADRTQALHQQARRGHA